MRMNGYIIYACVINPLLLILCGVLFADYVLLHFAFLHVFIVNLFCHMGAKYPAFNLVVSCYSNSKMFQNKFYCVWIIGNNICNSFNLC